MTVERLSRYLCGNFWTECRPQNVVYDQRKHRSVKIINGKGYYRIVAIDSDLLDAIKPSCEKIKNGTYSAGEVPAAKEESIILCNYLCDCLLATRTNKDGEFKFSEHVDFEWLNSEWLDTCPVPASDLSRATYVVLKITALDLKCCV
jgi:hypothetical protein